MWTATQRGTGCLSALLLIAAAGCRDRGSSPGPGASQNGAQADTPELGHSAALKQAPPAESAARGVTARTEPGALPSARPAPVGGQWLSCYASFQPRTDPKSDVARLGALCGPPNGMQRLLDAREGEIEDSGLIREHRFNVRAGECFRIFAVGEPSIEDLDIEVFEPNGRRLAFDNGDDRWPVVQPDGPFCTFETGEHRVRVRVARGSGRYAIEIWRLP